MRWPACAPAFRGHELSRALAGRATAGSLHEARPGRSRHYFVARRRVHDVTTMRSSSAAGPPARRRPSCWRVPAGRSRSSRRAAFPRRKVCGEFMSATNARLLRGARSRRGVPHSAGPEVRRARRSSPTDDHLSLRCRRPRRAPAVGEGARARNARPPAPGARGERRCAMFCQPAAAVALERGAARHECLRSIPADGEETLRAPVVDRRAWLLGARRADEDCRLARTAPPTSSPSRRISTAAICRPT